MEDPELLTAEGEEVLMELIKAYLRFVCVDDCCSHPPCRHGH
jgi:hypothetical protein